MKVFFASAIMCFVTLFVGFHFVFASNGCVIDGQTPQDVISGCQGGGIGAYDKWVGTDGTREFVIQFSQGAIGMAALFAIGALVFAGMRYTTAYGDDEKLTNAKNTGVAALIGLILCLIAFPLVSILVNFFYGLG